MSPPGVDVLAIARDGDARILRARNLHGGVLGQLGDHRVGVRIRAAVQALDELSNTQVGRFYLGWIVQRSPSAHLMGFTRLRVVDAPGDSDRQAGCHRACK